ncbi:MAG: hypothetical protein IJF43_08680 [Firmicutes bacterium]|nr:hypothetical protein [Bacillota bacterium]
MEKIKKVISNAEKNTKEIINQAIQTVDQNEDGKFDLSDIAIVAGSVESAAKKGSQKIKDSVEEKAKQHELKVLQPIIPEESLELPKFIRITERGQKYIDSNACKGSVGHYSEVKGVKLTNLFKDSIDELGIVFLTESDSEYFFADPTEPNHYIALDEYFNYMKKVRVIELERIAQNLGATYFKVLYKEEEASISKKKITFGAELTKYQKASGEQSEEKTKYSAIKIEAESHFAGHEPTLPQLKYLKNDPDIQALIEARMNDTSALTAKTKVLELKTSVGMSKSEASEIKTVLKGVKCGADASASFESNSETKSYLEYEIVF